MIVKLTITTTIIALSFAYMSCNNKPAINPGTIAIGKDTPVEQAKDTVLKRDYTNFDSTTNTDWLLIPGVSAGQTRLNENADSVYQRLGKPDGGDAAMMKAIAIWYAHHDTTDNSIAIYTSKNTDTPVVARIKQIRVTSPAFKTATGIHTTSTLQDIKDHFTIQKTETYKDAGTSYAVYDSKQGIAFEIAPDSICVAIVIHKSGVINEGTYLKFPTTNKFIDRRK